jgi:hypothetical protein
MNNEQVKQKIDNLKDLRRIIAGFILPIFSGEIVAFITLGNGSTNNLYIWLSIIGAIFILIISLSVSNMNKKIKSLINQLT